MSGAICNRSPSKDYLHLHPHAADTAVSELLVEEAPRKGIQYAFFGWIGVLRMVERVQRLPAKLEPLAFARRKRLEQTQGEIVRAAGNHGVAPHSGSVRWTYSLDPIHLRS